MEKLQMAKSFFDLRNDIFETLTEASAIERRAEREQKQADMAKVAADQDRKRRRAREARADYRRDTKRAMESVENIEEGPAHQNPLKTAFGGMRDAQKTPSMQAYYAKVKKDQAARATKTAAEREKERLDRRESVEHVEHGVDEGAGADAILKYARENPGAFGNKKKSKNVITGNNYRYVKGKMYKMDSDGKLTPAPNVRDHVEHGVDEGIENMTPSQERDADRRLKPTRATIAKVRLRAGEKDVAKSVKKHQSEKGGNPGNTKKRRLRDLRLRDHVELEEAKAKDIVRGLTDMDGPFTVVAIKNNKVIKQEGTKMRNMLPAIVKIMRKEVGTNVTIGIEDRKGTIRGTFKEDVELKESFEFQFADKETAQKFMREIMHQKLGSSTGTSDGKVRSEGPAGAGVGSPTRAHQQMAKIMKKHGGKLLRTDEGPRMKRVFKEEVEQVDEACWDTHMQKGMKMKGGKMVPNCVPKSSVSEGKKEKIKIKFDPKKKIGYEVRSVGPGGKTTVTKRRDVPGKENVGEASAAWQRKAGKNSEGGLNAKGRASYERENPGSDLKAPVSAKTAKKNPDGKAAGRRKSFCARMGGMPGPMKDENGKPTRKALALRKWDC